MATTHHSDEVARAFFYVDGVPTKGRWFNLVEVDSWLTVRHALAAEGLIRETYEGDILTADVEGQIAYRCFSSRFDLFDLDSFHTLSSDCARIDAPAGAVAAFIDWYGAWDPEVFNEAYRGCYGDEEAFAEQLLDETGALDEIPPHLRCYFDAERFARDLFCGDYYRDDAGFVFCANV